MDVVPVMMLWRKVMMDSAGVMMAQVMTERIRSMMDSCPGTMGSREVRMESDAVMMTWRGILTIWAQAMRVRLESMTLGSEVTVDWPGAMMIWARCERSCGPGAVCGRLGRNDLVLISPCTHPTDGNSLRARLPPRRRCPREF